MPAAVEALDWGWRHAGRKSWAVRHLDMRIEQGERVLLLGASGAGKSTLLSALAGLLHAPESGDEEGRLLVEGQSPHTVSNQTGIVFQDAATSLVMSRVGDEVAFGLENRAVPADQIWGRVDAALRAVEFSYDRSHLTDHLSGGEQQRLAIADVTAAAPRLWLLDEPTANLDPAGANLVRTTLRRVLGKTSATLILVEHRVAPVLELINRVIALDADGGLIADGPPDEVFSSKHAALHDAGIWLPSFRSSRIAPPRAAGPPVVELDDISVRYPGSNRDALVDATLAAHAGQAVAICGANGSGKSTLALVAASLLQPSKGAVSFLTGGPTLPYSKWKPRDLVRWVGTVFQEPEHQFVRATVADELALGPQRVHMVANEIQRRVDELLERFGLQGLAAANPFTLSGGEKRRLSVATALIMKPPLLILDEPTFGQDARTWGEIASIVSEQCDAGQAIVLITHDTDLVTAVADRRVALAHGHVVANEVMVS